MARHSVWWYLHSKFVSSNHIGGTRCFIEPETLPHFLVLIGSWDGFESDLHTENCSSHNRTEIT